MRRLRDRGGPAGDRYTMRERIFSIGDDYWIETDGGERTFKVNGKALRIRDTLVVENRSGEELLTIQEKKLSVRDAPSASNRWATTETSALLSPVGPGAIPAPLRARSITRIG